MFKCSKCQNYYQDTLKGLVGIYVIPMFYLICSILSILNSPRNKSQIDMEKSVLRKIIHVIFFFASFALVIPLRKLLGNMDNIFNQIALMGLSLLILVIQFLFPLMCLRKIDADYDFDYIQLLNIEEELTDARLNSFSNLSMNLRISGLSDMDSFREDGDDD